LFDESDKPQEVEEDDPTYRLGFQEGDMDLDAVRKKAEKTAAEANVLMSADPNFVDMSRSKGVKIFKTTRYIHGSIFSFSVLDVLTQQDIDDKLKAFLETYSSQSGTKEALARQEAEQKALDDAKRKGKKVKNEAKRDVRGRMQLELLRPPIFKLLVVEQKTRTRRAIILSGAAIAEIAGGAFSRFLLREKRRALAALVVDQVKVVRAEGSQTQEQSFEAIVPWTKQRDSLMKHFVDDIYGWRADLRELREKQALAAQTTRSMLWRTRMVICGIECLIVIYTDIAPKAVQVDDKPWLQRPGSAASSASSDGSSLANSRPGTGHSMMSEEDIYSGSVSSRPTSRPNTVPSRPGTVDAPGGAEGVLGGITEEGAAGADADADAGDEEKGGKEEEEVVPLHKRDPVTMTQTELLALMDAQTLEQRARETMSLEDGPNKQDANYGSGEYARVHLARLDEQAAVRAAAQAAEQARLEEKASQEAAAAREAELAAEEAAAARTQLLLDRANINYRIIFVFSSGQTASTGATEVEVEPEQQKHCLRGRMLLELPEGPQREAGYRRLCRMFSAHIEQDENISWKQHLRMEFVGWRYDHVSDYKYVSHFPLSFSSFFSSSSSSSFYFPYKYHRIAGVHWLLFLPISVDFVFTFYHNPTTSTIPIHVYSDSPVHETFAPSRPCYSCQCLHPTTPYHIIFITSSHIAVQRNLT
jgi:hypothetical protein